MMEDLLKRVNTIEGIEGSILLDSDGLVISSRLPAEYGEEITGALVADLCRVVEERMGTVGKGRFIAGYVFAGSGNFIYFQSPRFILAVLTSASANIGAVRLALRRSAKELLKEV
ncbi:MAG: roadblock/LC7 domain-containing protein [bacterium]